jgi:hypothetical protein
MEVFDSPDLILSCARRDQSTHAPQALELLNGEFSNSMASALAERVAREAGPAQDREIVRLFHLALGRDPVPAERAAAVRYVKDGPLRELALAILVGNDFLYVQ